MFLLYSIACTEPSDAEDVAEVEGTPLSLGFPYIPDAGAEYDPRVGDCSVTQAMREDDAAYVWVYDPQGRITSESFADEEDGTSTVWSRYWGWEGGCVVSEELSYVVDGVTSTEATYTECDAHANRTRSEYLEDGDTVAVVEYQNSYEDDQLVAQAWTYESDDEDRSGNYSFDWSDGWVVEVDYAWTDGEEGEHKNLRFDADDIGQLVSADTTWCADFGDEDCVDTAHVDYSFDAAGHVVALVQDNADVTLEDDGTYAVDDEWSVTGTFSSSGDYVPASATYIYDSSRTEVWDFTVDCG